MKSHRSLALLLAICLVCLSFGAAAAQPSQPSATISNTPAYTARYQYLSIDSPGSSHHVAGSISVMYNELFTTPYYAYYDDQHHILKEAYYIKNYSGMCDGVANSWSCPIIDNGGGTDDVGRNNSIAGFGGWSLPFRGWGISYYDATHAAVKLAEYRCVTPGGCSWKIETVWDPALGAVAGANGTALAYDSAGTPYVLYTYSLLGTSSVYLAYRDSVGTWHNQRLIQSNSAAHTDVGYYPSLAIHNNKLYAAFYDKGNDGLFYATNSGSGNPNNCYNTALTGWTCMFIDYKIGKWPSIAVTSTGVPMIASYDSSEGNINLATRGGSLPNCGLNNVPQNTWTCAMIESVGAGNLREGLSLALDGSDLPGIAYMAAQDQGPSYLRLARPIVAYGFHFPAGSTACGPASLPYLHAWACQTIDGGDANNDEAGEVALVLLPNGLANIGYSEDDSYHNITRLNTVYQRLFTFVPYLRK